MVKIYLVRHGETEENRNHRLCGWSDPPLNELGRQQAKGLASYFKDKTFQGVYTSGLKRTVETASIILGEDPEKVKILRKHEDLRELHFGDFEGETMDHIEKSYPQLYQQLRDDFIDFCFPKGESLSQMHQRVNQVMAELIKKHEGEEILLVVHSGVIRAILAQLITGDVKKHWNFKAEHCSVSVIEAHKDFYILSKLNEASFINYSHNKEGQNEGGKK